MNIQIIYCFIFISFKINNSLQLNTNKSSISDNNNDFVFENTEEYDSSLEIKVYENNTLNSLVYEKDVETSEELCTIDNIIEQLIPKDYEESKLLNISEYVPHINHTFERIERIVNIFNNYTNIISPITQKLMALLSPFIYEIVLPTDCMAAIALIADAISHRQLWAFKFIDSMGGIPSGLLDGVTSSFGQYSECLDIKSPAESHLAITGQYCIAKPIIPYPNRNSYKKGEPINNIFSIPEQYIDEVIDLLYLLNGSLVNIGICIPSTCSALDIENAINQILFPLIQMPIKIGPKCETKDKPITLDNYQLVSLLIFLTLFCITIMAAIYEHFYKLSFENSLKDKMNLSLLSKLIISFSIVSNTKAIFKKSTKKFVNIDFIRFLMLLQTILMHQYYVYLFWSAIPLTKRIFSGMMSKVGTDYRYSYLRNVHNTDFFFALSGLVATYSMIGSLERSRGKFNYFSYLINMYLRFYPSILGTILMYYLLPLVGSGPVWHLVDSQYVESCRKFLWPNLLSYNYYILDLEDFVHSSMCNIASWWATTCFHLLIFAPLIIIPLYKSPKMISLNLLLIVFGSVVSIAHILIKGIPVMNQLSKMNSIFEESFYSIFYTWPFIHHISPFATGVLTGYLIRKMPNLYLGGKVGETVLWFVFPALTVIGFHWTQDLMKTNINSETFTINEVATDLEIYLNLTLGKLLYCLGFLWIFYMCSTGRGGLINRLLSWNSLTPVYRLSLGIYLTNFLPPIYSLFSSRHTIELTDHLMLTNFAFNTIITIILAYILHILFESPVLNIIKTLESKNQNSLNKQIITKL